MLIPGIPRREAAILILVLVAALSVLVWALTWWHPLWLAMVISVLSLAAIVVVCGTAMLLAERADERRDRTERDERWKRPGGGR